MGIFIKNKGNFIFHSMTDTKDFDVNSIVAFIKEQEGLSVIVTKLYADNNKLKYTEVFSWITLTEITSLTAKGITSKISNILSKAGVPCNIIAGYSHDHIFISKDKASESLNLLNGEF